jgi:hypothetical protein
MVHVYRRDDETRGQRPRRTNTMLRSWQRDGTEFRPSFGPQRDGRALMSETSFLARCTACARDFHDTRHLSKHNRTHPSHEVLVLRTGEYDPKTGFKKREIDCRWPTWKSNSNWF